MKKIFVFSVACALILLWNPLAQAAVDYEDYNLFDEYEFDISPTQWQQEQANYQEGTLVAADQRVDLPADDVSASSVVDFTAASAETTLPSQELRDLRIQNAAPDQIYDPDQVFAPDALSSQEEYFRLQWLAQDQSTQESDPFYRSMLGMYIKNNDRLSTEDRASLLNDLATDSTTVIPSSYDDYLWMIEELDQRGSDDFDKDMLAGYIRDDDILAYTQKEDLLEQLGLDNTYFLTSETLPGITSLDSEHLSAEVPDNLSSLNGYDGAASLYTDEQLWGDTLSTGYETPFTGSGQPLTDYYDDLLDNYNIDTLN